MKGARKYGHTFYLIFFLIGSFICARAQQNNAYSIVWNSPSENASASMPCGGGDIGLNVWVEKGDLLIYVSRSGNFDENNALFKTGRIRVRLSPNILTGNAFKQELHLQEGYVSITSESNGNKVLLKIWVEIENPVVHIDINANKKINVEGIYESWRYQDRIIKSRENFGNSWKWAAPKNNAYKKDIINFENNAVVFYHHNDQQTIFDATVAQQGLDAVKQELYNPIKNLAFGGTWFGANFSPASTYDSMYANTGYRGWKLKSNKPSVAHSLTLLLHNEQVNDVSRWKQSLDAKKKDLAAIKNAWSQTQQWWQQFWDRSFIRIDESKKDSTSWQAGRNYQLFRYMLACNAKGEWPTKFNGGLFTVDPVYTDAKSDFTPDYRNWGGGLYTAQNQRLVYFPMIKNGDWDLLQPQLNFYLRLLKNAEVRSNIYWNHAGACFTEQMENYGLPDYAEYGQKRPAGFDKGLEYNAWLEYEWDTVLEFCLMMIEEASYTGKDIRDRIPFIESCLRFFDEHYQYIAKSRGIKALEANGKLVLYPGSGGETYKMAYNSTSTIAALSVVANRLLELCQLYYFQLPYATNTNYGNDSVAIKRMSYLTGLVNRIPPISFRSFNGHATIAPAQSWERINNVESMQLYPVYPWGIYGVGKPALDTALNTWSYDTSVLKFRSHIGWKQDNIWAARLGLANEAWQLTSLKLKNSERRFPAFWGPGFDWVPDHNWGGSAMIGLQEMLMQVDDKRILLFPAWEKTRDVHFKLHAPYNTTVEADLKNGKLVLLNVLPKEREKDVEMMLR